MTSARSPSAGRYTGRVGCCRWCAVVGASSAVVMSFSTCLPVCSCSLDVFVPCCHMICSSAVNLNLFVCCTSKLVALAFSPEPHRRPSVHRFVVLSVLVGDWSWLPESFFSTEFFWYPHQPVSCGATSQEITIPRSLRARITAYKELTFVRPAAFSA